MPVDGTRLTEDLLVFGYRWHGMELFGSKMRRLMDDLRKDSTGVPRIFCQLYPYS